ncbi:hypothetical protein ACSLMO_13355 [Flavobacterium columnare]|uniref:hypothetical protein n=1 Tax=Flavobacterium columnare TaxID=996 RepID=UPI0040337EE5
MKTLVKLVNGQEVFRKSGYASLENATNAGNSWKRDCRVHKNELDTRSFFVIDTELENEVLEIAVIKSTINDKGGVMSFPSSIRKGRVQGRPMRFNLDRKLLVLSDAELNIAFTLGLFGNNGRTGTVIANATRLGNICNL